MKNFFKNFFEKRNEEKELKKEYPIKDLYVCRVYLSSPDSTKNNEYTSGIWYNLHYLNTLILYGKNEDDVLVDPISGTTYFHAGKYSYKEHFCYRLVSPISLCVPSISNKEKIPKETIEKINQSLKNQ